jgi:hypothetical protein
MLKSVGLMERSQPASLRQEESSFQTFVWAKETVRAKGRAVNSVFLVQLMKTA